MEKESVIYFRDVPVYQRETMVFSGASLEIKHSEFVYLIGKTGTGKSSLLKAMYAELPVSQGQAMVAGYNLIGIKNREIPLLRRKLGIIFQDFQLLFDIFNDRIDLTDVEFIALQNKFNEIQIYFCH